MAVFGIGGIEYTKSFRGLSMKNLRSHLQGNSGGKGWESAGGNTQESAAELTRKIAAAYDGKSGAGIWLQILSEAEKSKRAGTLSNDDIDEFYRQFEPMLSAEQKQQLQAVVQRLKDL